VCPNSFKSWWAYMSSNDPMVNHPNILSVSTPLSPHLFTTCLRRRFTPPSSWAQLSPSSLSLTTTLCPFLGIPLSSLCMYYPLLWTHILLLIYIIYFLRYPIRLLIHQNCWCYQPHPWTAEHIDKLLNQVVVYMNVGKHPLRINAHILNRSNFHHKRPDVYTSEYVIW